MGGLDKYQLETFRSKLIWLLKFSLSIILLECNYLKMIDYGHYIHIVWLFTSVIQMFLKTDLDMLFFIILVLVLLMELILTTDFSEQKH